MDRPDAARETGVRGRLRHVGAVLDPAHGEHRERGGQDPAGGKVGVQPIPDSAAESGAVERSWPNAPQAAVNAAASA